jgi:predicted dehydrogenase
MSSTNGATRRDFLKSTAAAAGALAAGALAGTAYAGEGDPIKVGLVGCGGRGKGAAENVLNAARNVKVVALADVFPDRLAAARKHLTDYASDDKVKALGNAVDVPEDRCFVGLDAYEKLLAADVNYVMLATPPGFRPLHLQAAVAAGKHIFTEKPVGVDGPGIRKVLAAHDDSVKKGLGIAAGTQRRHQAGYVETIKRIHDGAIGDILAGRCYWNQGILWYVKRQPDWNDLTYQLRNWYNFLWVCGDHIVEQHVHNLDVCNWALQAHPAKARGDGGRQRSVPNPDDFGHIWDHFNVEFEYPSGAHVFSQCRQIDGCWNSVSEHLTGTQGRCQVNAYTLYDVRGENPRPVVSRGQGRKAADPYVQEHTDLIASIRSGQPINELKNVAESTLTAILGRMAAYGGKEVTWEQALNSQEETMPEKLSWDMSLSVPPVPQMGKHRPA